MGARPAGLQAAHSGGRRGPHMGLVQAAKPAAAAAPPPPCRRQANADAPSAEKKNCAAGVAVSAGGPASITACGPCTSTCTCACRGRTGSPSPEARVYRSTGIEFHGAVPFRGCMPMVRCTHARPLHACQSCGVVRALQAPLDRLGRPVAPGVSTQGPGLGTAGPCLSCGGDGRVAALELGAEQVHAGVQPSVHLGGIALGL